MCSLSFLDGLAAAGAAYEGAAAFAGAAAGLAGAAYAETATAIAATIKVNFMLYNYNN